MNTDKKEILRRLDSETDFGFPMLDNGYYYHGDQKITIFRDDERWAIMIEVLSFSNHEIGVDGITTISNVFGNCLIGWNDNDNFKYFADDDNADTFLYDEVNYVPFLNPKAENVLIRGQKVKIIFDKEHYLSKGIVFEFEDKITPWEFLRGLIPEYSNLFWVTRDEISSKIPKDLPTFMTLNNWHHPDLVNGEMPSEMETFQQIADVIISGNKNLYNTKESYNTHWSNWLEGGSL